MHFQKLRLAGFKSFVEPTELLIEPGLTGIVGPNGCGKSNLVEALRWVMGETSARQMRGGEMDDVIFGGTASRPSRNIAEVGLHLDNANRRAPAAFNKHDELEITRRIERSHGSTYRVNGREVRARDVQLLFADASSGARSTAIVSQGQIGAFIAARPEQRRAVIEEAAGITGLHSRRHEAELRLRGAETNLERLDDVVVTLEAQLQTLKKQARQANRYRRLSEHLRNAEALLFQARWREARVALATAKRSLATAEEAVDVTARAVASASAAQAEAARAVPTAREAEGRAAGALQKLVAEREAIDAEERREREALRAAETRLAEVRRDTERERTRLADAEAALRRLAEEGSALSADGRDEEAGRQEARERLAAIEAEVASLEERSRKAADELAAAEAERNALMRQVREAEERLGRVKRQQELVAKDHAAARAAAVDPALVQAAEAAVAAAEAALAEAGDAADKAAEDLPQRREAEPAARDALQSAGASLTALQAEERALAKVLTSTTPGRWRPLIDEVQVESGYEAALGAGLGDDLGAAVTEDAPIHWRNLPPLEGAEPLPEGTAPLSAYVDAPDLLGRRLGQIGVVEDERQGEDLAARLRPGQRLVSVGGMLWRWDGYVRAAGAETPTAKLLAQRNQLRAIRKRLPPAEAAEAEAKAALEKARAVTAEASRREKESRDAARAAQSVLEQRRREHAQLAQKATVQESRLVSIEEALERLAAEIADHEGQTAALRKRVAALGEPAAARDAVEGLRRALAAKREAFAEARSHRDRVERDIETRRKRVETIAQETTSWQERAGEAGRHLEALAERAAVEEEALAHLRERPGENAERRRLVLERIEEAEARRRIAADELALAERRLVECDGALKSAERALAEAREERVRREAAVAQATHDCETWIERTQERLHQHPETLGAVTGVAEDAELPEVGALEDRLQRLQRERESLGGVNLRAEEEVEAITVQIDTIHAEREDVLAAIAKLRRGIADLNREARERLLVAFDKVNAHFKDLFVRLFGGGQAHLALTEADDPLDAGLEIMASPPGKKMQSLTLLSGGERALTALSLLFAVFLTNPAPVCVLDEVDAPLDDANVDRFCTLLDEIAEAASTRFLIVTHHRLTMARMDRLYGVTMAERGVSQLVSVDLRVAEDLRATA